MRNRANLSAHWLKTILERLRRPSRVHQNVTNPELGPLERLEDRAMLADWGDAPEFYPTTSAEGGPSHAEVGPTLGATRTGEADGTHSANADADSGDDGVTFGTVQVGATGQTLMVNVQGGVARLDAWIDFNGDGSWNGPMEQIFDSVELNSVDTVLTFDVPSWAVSGTTFARFRLSTAGNLGIGGAAADGEVEDYSLTIIPPRATDPQFSSTQNIAPGPNPYQVFAADLDSDGHMDLLSAFDGTTTGDAKIVWYRNLGDGTFDAEQVLQTGTRLRAVEAADLDGDGDLDVVTGTLNSELFWIENLGSGSFASAILIDDEVPRYSLRTADMDGDGDVDVIVGGVLVAPGGAVTSTEIRWYENNGDGTFSGFHFVTDAGPSTISIVNVADIDGDGDVDVLTSGSSSDDVGWYENDGSGGFSGTYQVIDSNIFLVNTALADLDGDGYVDVIVAAGTVSGDGAQPGGFYWYQNNGDGTFGSRQTLDTEPSGSGYAIVPVDLDGDGDLDLMTSYLGTSRGVYWFENLAAGMFGSRQTISASIQQAREDSLVAVDLDGDGDLDVVANDRNAGQVKRILNLGGFLITQADSNLTVTEAGSTATFNVVLVERPATDVVLTITTSGTDEAIVDKTTLTFTPTNWNTPQIVTVTGVDDDLVDGPQTTTITIAIDAAASDDLYDSLADQTVVVTTTDDDARRVVVTAPAFGDELIRIFDAETDELIASFAPYPGFLGGISVALGDINGDSVDDIITGALAGGGPHVKVFDGRTLEPITGPLGSFFAYDAAFTGGVWVAAGDVNDDGHVDIITGAGAGGGPHVKVFSGLDGSVLMSFFAYDAAFTGGVSVASGDVNNDLFSDIITGAGPGGGPHVKVFSGDTGSTLMSFFAYDAGFTGGVNVAAGDVDGDLHADIINGAGPGGGPHVKVFSGADGSELMSFFAYEFDNPSTPEVEPTWTGGVYVSAGDIQGDSRAEIVTGAMPTGGPHVRGFAPFVTEPDLFSYYTIDADFRGGALVAAGQLLDWESTVEAAFARIG